MNAKTTIVLGGLLPALLFGVSGIFQKVSARAGIGPGPFLMGVGLTTMIVGGRMRRTASPGGEALEEGESR